MCPLGSLPAEKARNRPWPARLRTASAMIERAEFPVQMNSTLNALFRTASTMPLILRAQNHATRLPGAIDHQFTVLFAEFAALRAGKEIEHGFRRPAQLDAERRHHDGSIDQDRMRQHGIEQLIVGDAGGVESEVVIRGALDPHDVANRNAHARDQRLQHRPAGRTFQIFDHVRLDAGVADEPERVARRAAIGIVIDDDVDHGFAVSRGARFASAGVQAATGAHCSGAPAQQFSVRYAIRPFIAS